MRRFVSSFRGISDSLWFKNKKELSQKKVSFHRTQTIKMSAIADAVQSLDSDKAPPNKNIETIVKDTIKEDEVSVITASVTHIENDKNTFEKTEKLTPKRPRKRSVRQAQLHVTFKRPKVTSDDSMSKTKYYFENGLRKVVPYDHKYNTFCKGRWIGKTLREIYTSEFRLYPIEYYDRAAKEKRLLVNLEPATSLDQVLTSNDLLTSVVHRHECPISDTPIQMVAETEEFFVINKPCSIPLHPVGRFRFNTVISILAKEHKKSSLFSVHRIDRMTSGVILFAKSSAISTKIHKQIRERQVEKEYLCRVVGDFSKFKLPEGDHRIKVEGSEVRVNEPLKIHDMKIGIVIVNHDESSKESETVFKCLSTDGKTSVVMCKPKTGRTHQIRVHLQYLGYPITNDPIYNNSSWGEERFKFGPITKPMEEVMHGLSNMKKWFAIMESAKLAVDEEKSGNSSGNSDKVKVPVGVQFPESLQMDEGMVPFRPDCEECKNPLSDPKPDELIMYLHALRYKGPDWEFSTPAPKWASPDWVENGT